MHIHIYIYIGQQNNYHQNSHCSYPKIEANIFEARFLKRAAGLGSLFLAI